MNRAIAVRKKAPEYNISGWNALKHVVHAANSWAAHVRGEPRPAAHTSSTDRLPSASVAAMRAWPLQDQWMPRGKPHGMTASDQSNERQSWSLHTVADAISERPCVPFRSQFG